MTDMLTLNLGLALYLFESGHHEPETLDPDCGYNRPRMREAMLLAGQAIAGGAGRRFCRA
jgi:hypothetical protein